MTNYFNEQIIDDFHSAFSEPDLFSSDPNYNKVHWNIFCVAKDRLDMTVDYLNSHSDYPKDEMSFWFLLLNAELTINAVNSVLDILEISSPLKDETKFFINAVIESEMWKDKIYNNGDDKFFRYFRAISFAHCFTTSQHNSFIDRKNNEKQFSPFVILRPHIMKSGILNPIGANVYTNLKSQPFKIIFSFDNFLKYVLSRYELLELATNEINKIVDEFNNECLKFKISLDLETTKLIVGIKEILNRRYLDTEDVNMLFDIMTIEISNQQNRSIVTKFRNLLRTEVKKMANCLNDGNLDEFYYIIRIIRPNEKKHYPGFNYQYDKLFLGEDDYLARTQAKLMYERFAKDHLFIDFDKIELKELRILFIIAIYFEFKNNSNGK